MPEAGFLNLLLWNAGAGRRQVAPKRPIDAATFGNNPDPKT